MQINAHGSPTISQIAALAGVSRASVSRAFTRPELLSEATVTRIKEIARRIGYVPNRTARALSTGHNRNLALVVTDIANPFFPPLIRAAQMHADRSDFCVFLGNTDENAALEDRLIGRFASQVEGLVLVSSRMSEAQLRDHATRLPLVLVNRDIAGIPRILIDSAPGVSQALRHLAGLGHSHIVYVGGAASSWSNQQRRKAARETAKALGVTLSLLHSKGANHDAGRAMTEAILATGATAAVTFDDLLAQGVLHGLIDEGIAVPRDFSLIGFDDVLATTTMPPLTSISSRSAEAGQAAVGLLLDLLANASMRDVRIVLQTDLILRETTAGRRT